MHQALGRSTKREFYHPNEDERAWLARQAFFLSQMREVFRHLLELVGTMLKTLRPRKG